MGQAKLRGTFEERKAQGIIKNDIKQKAREEAMARREASLTPEQRSKRNIDRANMAAIMGLIHGR